MQNKFSEIRSKTSFVFRNNPFMLAFALIAAIFMIAFAEITSANSEQFFSFLKVGIISSLGISLSFAAKILAQRRGKEILFQVIAVLILTILYFFLPRQEKDFTEVYAFFLIPAFILSHLLVSFIAFINKESELNFWQFNKNLFINTFLTGIFTGVLTGGILLAILAVDKLFDFNLGSEWYTYTLYFLLFFGSVFIFLLFNENGLPYLERNGGYPEVLKFFTQYILIPLLLIYAFILYFYGAQIVLKWELPRGWVSYLILAYSVVEILALLLVHPLRADVARKWVNLFSRIFYYTLLPLIVLLYVSIFTRILEYGFTEPRYFVFILALWLTAVVLYFIFSSRPGIKFIPISLFIFGLSALILPYINAFAVAKRSQKSELLKILKEKELLSAGKINFRKKVNSLTAEDIADKVEFLAMRKESEFLKQLLPKKGQVILKRSVDEAKFYLLKAEIIALFTDISYNNVQNPVEVANPNTVLVQKEFKIDISEYQYLFKAYNNKNNVFEFNNNLLKINFSRNNTNENLTLNFNGNNINLNSDLQKLFENYRKPGEIYMDDLSIVKQVGGFELRLIFDSVTKISDLNNSSAFMINSDAVIILVRKK